MTNSNYENVSNKRNFRTDETYGKGDFKGRFGNKRDNGGFKIRLSDNEMKAVKSIQEAYQLRSTVAVLGFSVRTLSEMINDKDLKDVINKYAINNKNSSTNTKDLNNKDNYKNATADPFARPSKSIKVAEKENESGINDGE